MLKTLIVVILALNLLFMAWVISNFYRKELDRFIDDLLWNFEWYKRCYFRRSRRIEYPVVRASDVTTLHRLAVEKITRSSQNLPWAANSRTTSVEDFERGGRCEFCPVTGSCCVCGSHHEELD